MVLRALLPILLLAAGPVYGCIVVGVPDGDTLTLFCDGKKRVVDLAEVDAPELRQDFGTRAQQSLSDMCLRRTARIENDRTTADGRIVARVTCDDVSAGAEQLRRGMAWVSDEHAHDKTLYVAQNIARHAERGLWSGETPVAPWEWRRLAAAEAEVEAAALTKRKAARRTAPPPPEPDNPVKAFFKRLFGQ